MIRLVVSRAAALLAAIMLSGVPAVAAQLTTAVASCCCPGGHGGRRQCPMKSPGARPCHDSPADSGHDRGDCCPKITGPCTTPFTATMPPPRADEFTILRSPQMPRPPASAAAREIPDLRGDFPPLPETPPPRRA